MANYGLPAAGRKLRKPVHRFQIQHMPFQIQPFMIAPVIPGETMKNLLLQTRAVTDPINNKLVGWWMEYFFFYVKHRDIGQYLVNEGVPTFMDDVTGMMLDLTKDLTTSYSSAANLFTNHAAGSIDWMGYCLEAIVAQFFRGEGESNALATIDGKYAAAINIQNWLDSSALHDAYSLNVPEITVGGDDKINAQEISAAMQSWEFLRANNMTDLTYEDWLGTFGIRQARAQVYRPELLRYVREWQYPSNTINPETGAASSAISWALSERADKDRFFSEPGFVVGVTVARPKVYMKNVDGNAVDLMTNALSWLPALMRDDPWSSLKKVAHDKGPLATIVTDPDGYWVDIKDLLLYGDDFINVARSGTGLNMVSVPNANLVNKSYASDADVDGLFVGTTDATRQVRQDGIVTLNILGAQTDTTPPRSVGQ